ncbi:MAG TPA: hypothetical protein VFS34_04815 [Thermoanaerobaculia bacterium]|nr:hypothetical protein [Thermoanaerobaculia bacterium]
MRRPLTLGLGLWLAAASLPGQPAAAPPTADGKAAPPAAAPAAAPSASPATAPAQSVVGIFRIELQPSGSAFALGEPRLEGDTYVYRGLVEKAEVRVPKAQVRTITPLTRDVNKETAWQIDLVPSGIVIAREEPKLKSNAWVFHAVKNGTLMSLKRTDVRTITRLTGIPAFKAKQKELGASLLADNLPMEGSAVHPAPAPKGAAPATKAAPASPGNWHYEGVPGATDAYAPGNAVVAHPGDVPKAPEPPPPPPR